MPAADEDEDEDNDDEEEDLSVSLFPLCVDVSNCIDGCTATTDSAELDEEAFFFSALPLSVPVDDFPKPENSDQELALGGGDETEAAEVEDTGTGAEDEVDADIDASEVTGISMFEADVGVSTELDTSTSCTDGACCVCDACDACGRKGEKDSWIIFSEQFLCY